MAKTRDLAVALEIAAWLADHQDVPADQQLVAATDLLERFAACGWPGVPNRQGGR
jgi:hypothetical protein